MTPREPPLRLLVVASVLCDVAGAVWSGWFVAVPPALQEAIDEKLLESILRLGDVSQAALGLVLIFLAGVCVMHLAGLVGLVLYRSWARKLTAISLVILLLVSFWMGLDLYDGPALALSAISDLLLGMALAVAYWTPVAARFEGSSTGKSFS